MRLVSILVPIGLLLPHTVHCHTQQERLDALKDVVVLADLKHVVVLPPSLDSHVEDKDASPSDAEYADDYNQRLRHHKRVLLRDENHAIIEADFLALLDPQCKEEALSDEPRSTPMSMRDDIICPGTDADADADADTNNSANILQQFTLADKGIKARLRVDDQGGSSTDEHGLATASAPDDSEAAEEGEETGYPQSRKVPHASATFPVSDPGLGIMNGLEALRQLASLARSGNIDSARYPYPSASKPRDIPVDGKRLRSESTAEPMQRQPPGRRAKQPPIQPDILTRLEAVQRFSKLAKKLSILTDESGQLSLSERIRHVISDPEIAPTVQWVIEDAGKVLTPEVLSAVKEIICSSPLVPDEYRSFAVILAELLGPVFDPALAAPYQNVKASFEWLRGDLAPVLGSVYRGMHRIMDIFHPVYIQTVNNRVMLWQKALASPEMAEFLDVVTDPATLDGISSSMKRLKRALTSERVHRLRTVFDDWGFFDLNKDEYEAFGNVLGMKIKRQLATAEGISEMESLLDGMDSLLQSQTIHALADIIQKHATILTADLAEALRLFLDEVSSAAATVLGVLEVLRDSMDLIRPLLASGASDAWLPARVWPVARSIMDKVSSVRGSALADLQGVLDAGVKLMQPESVEELRVVLATLQMSDTPLETWGQVDVRGNASVGLETFSEFLSGMSDMHPNPVLETDANGKTISMLIYMLEVRLAPGVVEKTRETLQLVNSHSRDLLSHSRTRQTSLPKVMDLAVGHRYADDVSALLGLGMAQHDASARFLDDCQARTIRSRDRLPDGEAVASAWLHSRFTLFFFRSISFSPFSSALAPLPSIGYNLHVQMVTPLQSTSSLKMSDNAHYDGLMNRIFKNWHDALRPTPKERAQFGCGDVLYPACGRPTVEEGFSPRSSSAYGSPSSESRLSAKALVFIPGVGAEAEAQHLALNESLHSSSADTDCSSFVDIQTPAETSSQAHSADLFLGDPFASPRAPLTNHWTPMYIDPLYPRMGGGLLCTLPAITDHANANSDSKSEAILAQHAPILLALVKFILRNHNTRSRAMIRICTRQSYHLGEASAVPTVLVTLDFEEDRFKVEAALPEILHLFRVDLGLINVAVDIMDKSFAEWMDDHLERAMELDGRIRALPGPKSSLGELVDQVQLVEMLMREDEDKKRAVECGLGDGCK
ncbi:hypothetical protein BDW66DRAFT_150280 [Aspergillus desertorum]